jgi:hypothetical protein
MKKKCLENKEIWMSWGKVEFFEFALKTIVSNSVTF